MRRAHSTPVQLVMTDEPEKRNNMAEENEVLSLADLEGLQDEVLAGCDPNVDANALPPPIQPGKYLVKVTHQAEDEKLWTAKKTKAGSKTPNVPYMSTDLWCTFVDNPVNPREYNGRRISANNIMTLVLNDGSTGAMAVIQGLGKGPELANGPQTASRQCIMLSKLLQSEPLVGIEVDWEASWYSKEKEEDLHARKRGAKHFNKDEDGKYIPQLSIDGDEADVRPFVRRWLKVEELTGGNAPLHAVGATTQKADVVLAAAVRSAPKPTARRG